MTRRVSAVVPLSLVAPRRAEGASIVRLVSGTAPDISPYVHTDLINGVHAADRSIIWPKG